MNFKEQRVSVHSEQHEALSSDPVLCSSSILCQKSCASERPQAERILCTVQKQRHVVLPVLAAQKITKELLELYLESEVSVRVTVAL